MSFKKLKAIVSTTIFELRTISKTAQIIYHYRMMCVAEDAGIEISRSWL